MQPFRIQLQENSALFDKLKSSRVIKKGPNRKTPQKTQKVNTLETEHFTADLRFLTYINR